MTFLQIISLSQRRVIFTFRDCPPDHPLYFSHQRSLRSPQEQIILAPSLARVDMEMTQLTQENADFATRDRYHHSSLVSREQLMLQY